MPDAEDSVESVSDPMPVHDRGVAQRENRSQDNCSVSQVTPIQEMFQVGSHVNSKF